MKLTLEEMKARAADAGCSLQIEFEVTGGQGDDSGAAIEMGVFEATFVPLPEVSAPIGWGGTGVTLELEEDVSDSWDAFKAGLPGMSAEDFNFAKIDVALDEFQLDGDYSVDMDFKFTLVDDERVEDIEQAHAEALAMNQSLVSDTDTSADTTSAFERSRPADL